MVRLSNRKKLMFAALVVGGVFAVLEVLLAWSGARLVADQDPFVGFDSTTLFVASTDGDRWETRASKLPWFNAQAFHAVKPRGGLRIFCVGGSTTYGRPFSDSISYCGHLRHLLAAAAPDRVVEVVNAGGVSYASYRLERICREIAVFEPDAIVLYTGHNEFLEHRTYNNVRSIPAWQRESASWLGRTHTYSAVFSLLHPQKPTPLDAEVHAILDDAVGPEDYDRDDPLRGQAAAHFRWNLERIADTAARCGATLVLVTPASNLQDISPFKSQPSGNVSVDALEAAISQARQKLALGDAVEASAILEDSHSQDERYAATSFYAGKAALQLGRHQRAQQLFQQALEEDVCPLRAPQQFVRIVREVAAQRNLPIVDFESFVAAACEREHGHRAPGSSFFLDHVHPTPQMHIQLAIAIAELLAAADVVELPDGAMSKQASALQQRLDTLLTPEAKAASYRNLAKVLNWAGKHHRAGELALIASESISDAETHVMAAAHLREFQRLDEALVHATKATSSRPDWAPAWRLLGQLRAEKQQWPQAITAFQQWLALEPKNPEATALLGTALAADERWEDAVHWLGTAESLGAALPDGGLSLAVANHQAGEAVAAETRYREIIQRDAGHVEARFNLAILLIQQGRKQEAITLLKALVERDKDQQAAEVLRDVIGQE